MMTIKIVSLCLFFTAESMAMSLILLLCVVTVIQLTSSQPTYDVTEQENDDVNICGRTEHALDQLTSVVTELQQHDVSHSGRSEQVLSAMSQLQTTVAQIWTTNSQLLRDVAELKAAAIHEYVTGKLRNKRTGS